MATTELPTPAGRQPRFGPREPVLRLLAISTLINTFGNGLFYTLSALYFTRIVGLSVAQVGLGLTIAGGCGVLASIPFGHLADRIGARRMLIVLVGLEAVGTVAYTVIGSFGSFLIIVSLTTIADRASSAVRSALYAVVLPPETRTQARAYLRAVTNVGIGAGAAVSGIALQADTKAAYLALILLDAATFIGAAAILLRIPVNTAPPAAESGSPEGRRNRALKDGPYLVMAALNAVLALQFGLIEVGLPLWIVGHTQAPRAMVAVTLLTNTVLCVLLQVRASRRITSIASAASAARRGGILLAACCLIFAAADGVPALPAALILLAGIVVQTLAEVVCSAAGWALSYDLADPAAPGAYQGVFTSGFATAGMLAPIVATSTALRFGFAGWVVLGAIFVAAGATLAPVSRWAADRRAGEARPEPVG
jgi:MFS family permease